MGTDTKRLLALREQQASANARTVFLTEQLLEEVKALRQDLHLTTRDLQDHKLERSQEQAVLAGTLATINARLDDHGKQLADIHGKSTAKQVAWGGVMPSIIASVAGALLASAITAAIVIAINASKRADEADRARDKPKDSSTIAAPAAATTVADKAP